MKESKGSEFVQWFGPVLDTLQGLGGSGKPKEVSELVAKKLKVPQSVLEATNKNGGSRFENQVAWARQYLVNDGYIDPSIRGTWVLTEKGRNSKLTQEESRKIFLDQVKRFQQLRKERLGREESTQEIIAEQEGVKPEVFEKDESVELINVLRKLTPKGFEEVCGLLLRESGFENVEVTGRSGDGGFDGKGKLLINPFVSVIVSFQCKRYQGSVGRSEVGDFRNSVLGRAEKGIFLTTGTFTAEARKEADRVDPKIELVDGEKLVQMFEKVELGIKPKQVYEVDVSFFEPYSQKH